MKCLIVRCKFMSNDNGKKNSNDFTNHKDEALSSLKQRLASLEEQDANSQSKESKFSMDGSNMAIAFRACTELILSIFVCGAIGYGVDYQFGFSPVGMIIGLLIGMAVGFSGVYRITNNMGMSVGYAKQHQKKQDDSKKNSRHSE